MSGKINTSEAAQLWEESRSIREWSKGRIDDCENECGRLRVELAAALERVKYLEEHIAILEKEGQ